MLWLKRQQHTGAVWSQAGLEGSPLFWAQFASFPPTPPQSQLAAKLRIRGKTTEPGGGLELFLLLC